MAAFNYTATRGLSLLGDEVGAWMADTTEETLVGTQEVVNGDFTTTDVTFWGTVDGAVTIAGDGKAAINYSGPTAAMLNAPSYLDDETDYEIIIKLSSYTSGLIQLLLNPSLVGSVSSTTEQVFYVRANVVNGRGVQINASAFVGDIDYIYVRKAVPDLSSAGNGLGVHGSIIKSAVATGADLVAFSNFSATNYLEQPYNSDLDPGIGDFAYGGWFKIAGAAGVKYLMERCSVGGAIRTEFLTNITTGYLRTIVRNAGGVADFTSSIDVTDSEWRSAWLVFDGTTKTVSLYIGGTLIGSHTASGITTMTDTSAILTMGARSFSAGSSPLIGGSKALWRELDYAPTAAQIKTIYDKEKHLFKKYSTYTQEGESYELDIVLTAATETQNTIKNEVFTLSGKAQSTVHRDDINWAITTDFFHRTDVAYVLQSAVDEFLYSTRGSERFLMDLYESGDDVTVIRVGNSVTHSRETGTQLFRVSFTVRER